MSSIATFLSIEKEKARKVFEHSVLAEAAGKKLRDPQATIDALATLELNASDFEQAVQIEKTYLDLLAVANEEDLLRKAMHLVAQEREQEFFDIKQAEKELVERRRRIDAKYETARADFQRAHDASCRLLKIDSIQGRILQKMLASIQDEQRECGRRLTIVREKMQRARIDVNSLHAEFNRTQDPALHARYHSIQEGIKLLELEESKLIKQSEQLRDRYERVRITRGIDGAASGDGADDL